MMKIAGVERQVSRGVAMGVTIYMLFASGYSETGTVCQTDVGMDESGAISKSWY